MTWLIAATAVVLVIALALRWKNGRFAAVEGESLAELAVPFAARATFVQFSSQWCSTCRATKRLLDDLAASEPGVGVVEVRVEDQGDLVERLSIMRTPTVFVTDATGRVLSRASGEMTREQLIAALPAR